MQRLATPTEPTTLPQDEETACPVCGAPVEGIAASRPGEHRFVGCGHYASARFLRQRSDAVATDGGRPRLGP